jgi:hypothetical protein
MKTRLAFHSSSVVLVLLLVGGPLAAEIVVGNCRPGSKTYSTISQAVAAAAPGTTVLVCPGTYPEQVTITQPLTLRGVQSGNFNDKAVITTPVGGFTQSVVSPTNGAGITAQIFVLGTESGLVNISNISVDGGSKAVGVGGWFAGIYYQDSSGSINNIAAYGQMGNGYGFGMLLEGATPTAKNVTVKNSSVHDFDSEGIRTNGSASPPSLTVNIESNIVISSTTFGGSPVYGEIDIQGATGVVRNNQVVTHPAPPGISAGTGIAGASNLVVSNNFVEGTGIWLLGDSNTITGNRVAFGGGIIVSGQNNIVRYNSIFGDGISFNCIGTMNTVINNTINDSFTGIQDHPGNIISPNTFINVGTLVLPPC